MICEHCNQEIDQEIEQMVHTLLDGKKTIVCRECYEDYWDKKERK
jgi:uncharacterized protein with PIN domain